MSPTPRVICKLKRLGDFTTETALREKNKFVKVVSSSTNVNYKSLKCGLPRIKLFIPTTYYVLTPQQYLPYVHQSARCLTANYKTMKNSNV